MLIAWDRGFAVWLIGGVKEGSSRVLSLISRDTHWHTLKPLAGHSVICYCRATAAP